MLIGLAILLALLTFGLKAYAEWTGNATAGALGYLAVAGALVLIGIQVKSVADNTYIEGNDTGLSILLTIAVAWILAFGFAGFAVYKIQDSLSI